MCGICGYVDLRPGGLAAVPSRVSENGRLASDNGHGGIASATPTAALKAMADAMIHRGPDDAGYFVAKHAALAMRRLSIIDLASGKQPISNEDGTLWIVFNGEIYNYRELRGTLLALGHRFKTQSDTEVILHAYEEFGEECVRYLNGMFAFVIWDERAQTAFGARDRFGIKPFYYTLQDDTRLIFGSELKTVLANPEVPRKIDLVSLSQYLSFEYVPSPRTMLRGINKLPAGHWFKLSPKGFQLHRYWDVTFARSESRPPSSWTEYREQVREHLREAVRLELVSDVPVGVFLSGGLDSSAVAAMMSRLSTQQVSSFSIGFEDPSFDESKYARLVAQHLGLKHHELTVTDKMVYDLVPMLGTIVDEPLGDSSIIPTYYVSKLAREHVKVVLGGDGGDELFAGYPTLQAHRLVQYYELLPYFMRANIIPRLVKRLPVSSNNISFDFKARRFIAGRGLPAEIRHHRWLGSFTDAEKQQVLLPESLIGEADTYDIVREHLTRSDATDPVNRLMYCDLKLYLEGDILAKVDRASMANSLEVRVPILNSALVNHVLPMPHRFKLKQLTSKFIFKKAMQGILPDAITGRKKKGFNFPVARFLRSGLKEFAHDMLSESSIKSQGLFDSGYVQRILGQHMSGEADHRKLLWTLLAFQSWHAATMRGSIGTNAAETAVERSVA